MSWASDVEAATIAQAAKAASLPFVEKPLALMPDAHVGLGATVGSVIATVAPSSPPPSAWTSGAG